MIFLHRIYRIRTCTRNLPRDIGKDRPCLYYHIKQCDAPCQGYISKEDYQKQIRGALDFLGGKYAPVTKALTDKMYEASEQMEFEKAAEYRDLIKSVNQNSQKQKITSQSMDDRDVIAMARTRETWWCRCSLSGTEGSSGGSIFMWKPEQRNRTARF